MTKHLCIVTSNTGKFEEIQTFLQHHVPTLSVQQKAIDLPEIQSLDLEKVAITKAQSAWQQVQQPLLIDDGGFFLEAYNNFPGALSRYVIEGIGIEGIFTLAQNNSNASFRNYLVYIDKPDSYQLFEGVCTGELVRPKQYTVDKRLPYRSFFRPHGTNKTYAELKGSAQESQFHHRIKALKQFITWLQSK